MAVSFTDTPHTISFINLKQKLSFVFFYLKHKTAKVSKLSKYCLLTSQLANLTPSVMIGWRRRVRVCVCVYGALLNVEPNKKIYIYFCQK